MNLAFVEKRFVDEAVVLKKLVVVAFPTTAEVADSTPKFAEEEKRFVVVADVPVAFTKVKFWRVDEPVRRRFERVESPPVAVKVVPTPREPPVVRDEPIAIEPVKFAVSDIV